MSKLLFQGHGSLRFTMNNGQTIYLDPFAGGGYERPADYILITHEHFDHNKIGLIKQKPQCAVIRYAKAGDKFEYEGLTVEATEAFNKNHDKNKCVGFILEFDGLKIYCSGDTGITEQMQTFANRHFDYAVFNTDDTYTIPFAQSAKIAAVIGAKHNIPIHIKPVELFDLGKAQTWRAPNKLIIDAKEEIDL